MDNLPEVRGCIWVNIRGTMRSIPAKGFFITTVDEFGSNDFKPNQAPSPCDTYIFKDGILMTDVQGFSISASIDDIIGPTLVLVLQPQNIQIEGLVERT